MLAASILLVLLSLLDRAHPGASAGAGGPEDEVPNPTAAPAPWRDPISVLVTTVYQETQPMTTSHRRTKIAVVALSLTVALVARRLRRRRRWAPNRRPVDCAVGRDRRRPGRSSTGPSTSTRSSSTGVRRRVRHHRSRWTPTTPTRRCSRSSRPATRATTLIVPSDYMVGDPDRRASTIQTLNKDADPQPVQHRLRRLPGSSVYDPEGDYSVPYQWGTPAWRSTPPWSAPTSPAPGRIVFDPESATSTPARSRCSTIPRETLGAALKYLGYSLNSTDQGELDAARDLISDSRAPPGWRSTPTRPTSYLTSG